MSNAVARWLLGTSLLALTVACGSVEPVVKIGLVAPFEGHQRAIGYDAIYSARLAVREVNEAGGVAGHRVALVALDDRGDPKLANETAMALVIDPALVAVVGHYLPETTEAARDVYANGSLPLLAAGEPPFDASDAAALPADFLSAYAAVSPLDETAGDFSGPTYDAFQLLWSALAVAEERDGEVTRATVQAALRGLEYEGVTGVVFQP